MGDLVIEQLRRAGLRGLAVAHGSARRAASIARRYDAHHMSLSELPAGLVNADVVVSALGSGQRVVTADMMAQAIKLRRHRPVLLIDVAVRSAAPNAGARLAGGVLFRLGALGKTAVLGRFPPALSA